jgi:hypothetical protein
MSPEETLAGWLSNYAPLTAEVDDRLYPDVAPEPERAVLPLLVYLRGGTEPIATIHGSVLGAQVTLQTQAWATTRPEAEAIGDLIVSALAANGEPYIARDALYDETTGNYGVTVDVTILALPE